MVGSRTAGTRHRARANGRNGSPAPPVDLSGRQAEVARYIADMTSEMTRMASGAKLDLLAYLLSMARAESELIARRDIEGEPPDALE